MRPKIYIFGDSITEESFGDGGWGASLAHHFSRTADIMLRGYSGYNTRWALKVFDKVFPAADCGSSPPLAVTVFFGANDACLPDRASAFQHVPVDEYKQNLRSIFSLLKKRWPETVVILITPPPIDEAARMENPFGDDTSGLSERTNEVAGCYAKACVEVANECGTPVADLWTRMQKLSNWKESLRDGLHLSQRGNRIVFEEVVDKLRQEGLSLEKLPVDQPLFSNIDPNNALMSFQD